jgi:hypothetical protein
MKIYLWPLVYAAGVTTLAYWLFEDARRAGAAKIPTFTSADVIAMFIPFAIAGIFLFLYLRMRFH